MQTGGIRATNVCLIFKGDIMPIRNCMTRPVSWKTHRNKALSEAVLELGNSYGDVRKGFIVWPMWIGFLTHRDNCGFFNGSPGSLREDFYPHHPEVTIDEVRKVRDVLKDRGLIIVYQVEGLDYVLVPKVSKYSKIVGNISDKSDFPPPPEEVIKEWEARFNEVYTPLIRRTNDENTPDEQRMNDVSTESKSKRESKSKNKSKKESKNYTTAVEKFFNSIDPAWFKTLQAAYPKINLTVEFGKMKAWLVSNPDKEKKNIKRFAVNWLSRNKPEGSPIPSGEGKVIITDNMLENRLGRIATKDMIKKLMKEIPQTLWWKIDQFLKRRYPGSNGSTFAEAQRELVAEAREGKDRLTVLTGGIGKAV